MDVVARPAPFRAPLLRPLMIVLLIGLLVGAALALYAGSQRTRLPEPFGPARNGAVFVDDGWRHRCGRTDNRLATTMSRVPRRTLRRGSRATDNTSSSFGVRVAATRLGSPTPMASNQRELGPAPNRVVRMGARRRPDRRDPRGGGRDVDRERRGWNAMVLDAGYRIDAPFWRPGHDQIVFLTDAGDGPVYHLMNADGTGAHRIEGVSPDAINRPVLSADGSKLVYSTWADSADLQGRIHVVDIDTGIDEPLMFEGSEGTNEFPYAFSPDGSKLLLERHAGEPSYKVNGEFGYRLVIVPADGRGPAIPIGPAIPSGPAAPPPNSHPTAHRSWRSTSTTSRPGCSSRRLRGRGGRLEPAGRIQLAAPRPLT